MQKVSLMMLLIDHERHNIHTKLVEKLFWNILLFEHSQIFSLTPLKVL